MGTSITSTSITEGQKKQYKRFVEDAADKALVKAGLDKDGLQRVIENGDDLQSAIVAKLRDLSITNEYADEEVRSNYGYLSGYKPKGIAKQIKALRKLFPRLGTADESIANKPLPAGAEGWFAIPRYELVVASYNDAVQKVLDLIKKDRKGNFYNWREGRLGPQYLRQTERAVRFWKKLGEEQKGAVRSPSSGPFRPSGSRHHKLAGVRARRFRGRGVVLLTHPERLKHNDDLWINCAGDKYSSDADGVFSFAPIFDFLDGKVYFYTHWVEYAHELHGSASGFVSQ